MAQSCDRIVAGLRRIDARIHVVHLSRRPGREQERLQHGGSLLTWPLGDDHEHALARLHARVLSGRHPPAPDPPTGDQAGPRGPTHLVAFGGTLPLLAGPVLAASLGIPLVTLLRGNDLDTGVVSLRRRPIVADAMARSALVCCVSRDKQHLVEAMWPGTPTAFTPNGIDLDEWEVTPADRQRAAAWRRATVAPERRVIGLFGHLKAKKGVDWFLTTIERAGLTDRFHLLLVGELDPATSSLLDPARCTHVPFGDRYDLLSHLPACDVVAIPSFYDGLPNVLLEAAAAGVPLLAADTAGMADTLGDGSAAFLFRPDDGPQLEAALAEVATCGREELVLRGKAARELVVRHHTSEREAARYREVLTTVLTGRGAGPGPRPTPEPGP